MLCKQEIIEKCTTRHSMNSEAQSGSVSHKKSTLNTEGFDAIKIKSEPESPCTVDSEHTGQVIEPLFTIDKNEYEFQPSYFKWTEDKLNSTGEDDYDNDKYDDDDDKAIYDDEDEDDNSKYGDDDTSEDDDLKDYEEKDNGSKPDVSCKIKRNPSRRNKYTIAKEKENYLDSYMSLVCPYCNIALESSTAFKAHLDEVHNHGTRETDNFSYTIDGKAKCIECKALLKTKLSTLKSHIWLHLPFKNVYNCKLCPFTNVRHYSMVRHIERQHFDVVGEAISTITGKCSNVCAYCGKYAGFSQMVSTHIKKEHGEIYEQKLCYICPSCGEEFEEEKCHKEHLQSIHQFDTCGGLSFELIEEQETDDRKKYRCLKCNVQMSCRFCYLAYHALTHLPHKCFKCRFCDYTHDKKWKVIKHTCEGLLLEIKNNPNLTAKTKHSKFNSPKHNFDANNKLFVCPKCGENFKEQSLWEEHLINAHNFGEIESFNFETTTLEDGESVTRCMICEKKFFKCNIYNFKLHAFTHMPYKIYKCKLCEKPLNSLVACSCQVRKKGPTILYVCPQCGKEFKLQGMWKIHIVRVHNLLQPSGLSFSKLFFRENEAASYKCSDCGEVIQESDPSCIDLLFKHATIKHLPFKCYKCYNCGESNDNKEIMLEHVSKCKIALNEISPEDEAQCSKMAKCMCYVCGYLGDSEENIVTHLRGVHQLEVVENNIFTWFCNECELEHDSKEEILEHILNIHLKKGPMHSTSRFLWYFCPVCNTKIQTHPEWIAHIYEQHALNRDDVRKIEGLGKDWKCLQCNKIYKKNNIFLKLYHSIIHLPHNAFKCIICGVAFKNVHNAKRHVKICSSKPNAMHGKRRKLSEGNVDVAQDAAKHKVKRRQPRTIPKFSKSVSKTSSDPLQIDKSNVQNYSQTTMAIRTSKSHGWNKYCKYMTYACPECNMHFDTSEAWHMHISTHHDFFSEERLDLKPVPGNRLKRICEICGVTVHGGGLLHAQRHKLTHMPYQAFICKICKHRSRTHTVLMYHIERRHFTLGQFKCSICQVVFETCHKRFEHTNAEHSACDEWPENVCRICMKELNTKHSLKEHMKTHETDRVIYECGFCTRRYYHDYERKKHWKQRHPVEDASMVKEGHEKLVVQKPVKKTMKGKLKGKVAKSDECSDGDSSSDSVVLSKLKYYNNATTMEVKKETQSEANTEETSLVKFEPEKSNAKALASFKANQKRIVNKTKKS